MQPTHVGPYLTRIRLKNCAVTEKQLQPDCFSSYGYIAASKKNPRSATVRLAYDHWRNPNTLNGGLIRDLFCGPRAAVSDESSYVVNFVRRLTIALSARKSVLYVSTRTMKALCRRQEQGHSETSFLPFTLARIMTLSLLAPRLFCFQTSNTHDLRSSSHPKAAHRNLTTESLRSNWEQKSRACRSLLTAFDERHTTKQRFVLKVPDGIPALGQCQE